MNTDGFNAESFQNCHSRQVRNHRVHQRCETTFPAHLLRAALPICYGLCQTSGGSDFLVFVRFVYLRTVWFVRRRQAKCGAVPPERLRGERRGFWGQRPHRSSSSAIAAFGFSLSLRPLFFSGRGERWFPRPSTGNLLSAGRWTACNVTYSGQSRGASAPNLNSRREDFPPEWVPGACRCALQGSF